MIEKYAVIKGRHFAPSTIFPMMYLNLEGYRLIKHTAYASLWFYLPYISFHSLVRYVLLLLTFHFEDIAFNYKI